ncbi:PREDICTED: serine/arginine repetitive matrix protein 1-like isoform X2 [Vollenhovia emeryi]|uniref:serine/arginine repetitive matrix protein 1-like isoform X2 n=1 Tax=Vollenhovia emeryi TaxID=411798 RepID=UPI0005F4C8E8|nr:PREDICTED: serine/arginine repetitive matrix protein 1-like isoform X2 [Vollenhovia emeryi]
MDHRQKMVVVSQQSKVKIDDDDDEDVEALRLAALKSLRTKDATHKRPALSQVQKVQPQITQSSRFSYKNQRPMKKNCYHNRVQQRQNGNVYYQSPRNPNLIAIVPVDEPSPLQQAQLTCSVDKTEPCVESYPQEVSKFHRFKDSGSASEEEDVKEQKSAVSFIKTEVITKEEAVEFSVKAESQEETTESQQKNGDEEEDGNDDDDDILLMADLEEEDSLERLMDEMEKEMNDETKLSDKREKKLHKGEAKATVKGDEGSKSVDQKTRTDDSYGKKERNNVTTSLTTIVKNDRRSVSPHAISRISQKRRSLSPRSRPRKKSPRRSPRRSPIRQLKKSPRETSARYRSPPLSRYSPRSRSPRLSPRRSPNRTSTKRSPLRKLSPRGRSPKLSSRSRSPRPYRSRSPRRSKSPRPRSPKISRSRTPRLSRSRSPRYSPPLRSPRSKSPRLSPRRVSPRRLRSRSRSPGLSSPRRGSSRLRSPKASPRRTSPRRTSPRRTSPRLRSPRLSPHRSPWSSPRHSPRLSPRRKRSPKWSPKELPRKHGPRSVTPDNRDGYMREPSPIFKGTTTPEMPRTKAKQKDEVYERPATEVAKEPVDTISDPVLEARRKKFESTQPIDPVNANKKIKLSKKHTTNTKVESSEETEIQLSGARRVNKAVEEYDVQEVDLCLEVDYELEECEEAMENTSPGAFTSAITTCIDTEPQKTEKEKPSKKKKKRDKELYQVGKLKNELPLSERIGKDKKCKKRKDVAAEPDVDAIFEDITIDEEGDLRTELSRRRAERLNRTVPIQSARLVQSAFKGVVNEAVKNNAKTNQRHIINTDEKPNQKEVRRVTVLHRTLTELHDSEDETTLDSKVPVRLRLGLNKQVQESRESKVTRKATKRQGRKE